MKRILILSANPKNTAPLRLDEEMREIKEGLRRAKQRDNFVIETGQAVRYRDIRRAILDFEPNIVHFSGHGAGEEGLAFEDETGQVKLVEAQALASLFELFADQIECVVLNACYSEVQAKAIAEHIPYVVGMSKSIGDKAAIEFAVGFYDALGAGRTVEFAYKLGCNSIEIAGISEHLTPQLLSNSDILTNTVSSQAEVNHLGEPSTKYNQKQTTIDQLDSELKEKEMPSVFICYSHKDEIWRDRLLEFLQSLNFEKQIVWSDLDLEQGDIWDEKIKEVLPKVTVAVVLVSQAILNSTYVRNEELPRLLQRFEDKKVRIIPLFVKYADVENVPFNYTNEQGEAKTFYLNNAQSPPNNSPRNPLYTLPEPEQDKVLLSVVQNLRSLIDKKKR
ncbi:MAG: TIR domain-containing protein [Microcystis panniformis]